MNLVLQSWGKLKTVRCSASTRGEIAPPTPAPVRGPAYNQDYR
jgi:hypothetical protein